MFTSPTIRRKNKLSGLERELELEYGRRYFILEDTHGLLRAIDKEEPYEVPDELENSYAEVIMVSEDGESLDEFMCRYASEVLGLSNLYLYSLSKDGEFLTKAPEGVCIGG